MNTEDPTTAFLERVASVTRVNMPKPDLPEGVANKIMQAAREGTYEIAISADDAPGAGGVRNLANKLQRQGFSVETQEQDPDDGEPRKVCVSWLKQI
jgi:hypothetical protein